MVQPARQFNVGVKLVRKLRGHVEPKSGTTCLTNPIIFTAVELIEYLSLISAANTDSCIFDREAYLALRLLGDDGYTALLGIFNRIGDEVL